MLTRKSELMEELICSVRNSGFRLTEQRRDILKTLVENAEKHLTADELHKTVRQINPDIGLTTIYRTLELLEELDLVRRLNLGEQEDYFEFVNFRDHHHHLVCLDCGRVIEFKSEDLNKFEENIEEKYGFIPREQRIKFFGSCQECQMEQEDSAYE
ncbi:Fur family transcriptional regulator [Halarsenatibacter silvermanii]|uniref:Fur family transcriptional regulator, ferric uptake regulator n=1 Tax=Halarsenatibacter silvermanii TaxID=321763 RepID=A0A1G9IXG3_9FIRM|nr:Fur family transcriptional regulator [Halarsenatibacter silvermanii]SDL29643.1 Fur family transcriptional regulator, ferric uptake regulator [Halarsenatibacter silvermanii]